MDMVMAITTTRLRLLVLSGVTLCGVACSAQAQTMATQTMTSADQTAMAVADLSHAAPLLLGPGDLIEVQVFGTAELSGRQRIDQQGILHLPIGGSVDLNGVTSAQAGTLIEKALKDAQLMLDPHVTVLVAEYATQGVTILGEVKAPGTFNLFGPHSLYDALSAAGGPTATEGATITITHRRDPQNPLVVPVNSPNFSSIQRLTAVEPGDTIVVSKASLFYVVGDVIRPGAFYLQNGEPLSVLNALALAQGLNKTAKATRASIVRPTATGAETIPLDLNKIMKNIQPDVVLQASDVLVVPRSGMKVFLETALPSATSAVTGAVSTALIVR
jgi:polysaccharide export outer membrane protein